MTTIMLVLLTLQTLLGALDNVLHHEITERLPSRPSARRELALHSGREFIYGVLFLVFAWVEPSGIAAMAVLALLAVEIVITIADFLEEDRTRKLPPFERVLHTVLAIIYGAFVATVVPWLVWMSAFPTSLTPVDHGLFSWFFTVASIGVFGFAIRNFFAVRALGRHAATVQHVPSSGRTVLVTGGTGFIGSLLVQRLVSRGDRVFALSRDPRQARVVLGHSVQHIESLADLPAETRIDAVVNLAGAPIIGLPWTPGRRRAIRASRIGLTRSLVEWMGTLEKAPAVLVSGSAIGFYGDRADEAMTEAKPAGDGFAADLCRDWETEAFRARALGTRVVCLRTGLVLDTAGGALPMMALPARFGLGAVFGNGKQWMSWITRADLVRMIISALDSTRWEGAINAVAPEPLRHGDFQRAMARALRRPLYLGVPAWVLKLAMGEMSTIFLHSQRVVPQRAQELGFTFDVHWAADALNLLLAPRTNDSNHRAHPLHSGAPMTDIAPDATNPSGVANVADGHRSPPVAFRPQGKGGARGEAA